MSNSRKVFRWINRALPIGISVISLSFSGLALHHQTQQSKMQLWHSLRQEYDHQMVRERKACGVAFENGTLGDQCDNMMSFYDTLGFLVRTGRIDDDVFGETWSYDFIAYFKAFKPFMDQDRAEDPDHSVWQNIYDLARKYHDDPLLNTPEKTEAYWEEEKNLVD